jgi:hypothetical protein
MGIQRQEIDEAFEAIEETILPSITMMLDTLIDSASLAQPGLDAEAHAAELRALTMQLEALTRQVEAVSALHGDYQEYRSASVA